MILLVVILLTMSSAPADDDGWSRGNYFARSQSFISVAACEAARARLVEYMDSPASGGHIAAVSNCGTKGDAAVFHLYGVEKPTPRGTLPMTPPGAGSPSAPKIGI